MRDSHSYGAPPIFERAVVARVPRRRLSRPLPLKGGGVLPTVGEAANYVVTLDQAEHMQSLAPGHRFLLEQADVAAIGRQVHLAFFYEAALSDRRC
jgi:hypothetical protein